jgi:HK97 family phage major capsid protein
MKTLKAIEKRSMPTLLEQRNNLITEAETLVSTVKTETRSMKEEESSRFDQIQSEIKQIDKTIQAETVAQQMASQKTQAKAPEQEEQRALAVDKFVKYIKGDTRALDVANNGAIIPTEIANDIITRVKELSPIYQRATVFNVGGDLVFPAFDTNSIVTAYVADLQELTAQNGNFTSRKLQNFIAGSLVTLSRSLLNRSDFALAQFVTNQMAQSISNFIERELLIGAGVTSATGIFSDANVTTVTPAGATFTADDLISQQLSIPQQFQNACAWIMNKATFAGFRKLKDANGNYLLNRDITGPFGWEILGKPVFISENAPTNAVAYGDYSGLYVKLAQGIEIQLLTELFATQHALGVVGYVELDSRIIEDQKISVMETAGV